MASFLYWNLLGNQVSTHARRRSKLLAAIRELAIAKNLDVLIFSECFLADLDILGVLNAGGKRVYRRHGSKSRRIRFFSRLPPQSVGDVYSDPNTEDRLAIQRLQIGKTPNILLVGCHFFDRLRIPSEGGRASKAREHHDTMCRIEDKENNQRTILVGDLNMNLFESGVVGSDKLHAVMTKELARSVVKLKHRTGRRVFYNPMWRCFGDSTKGAHGSYYYWNIIDSDNHFWNIYDQILLRPLLMDTLINVEIIESAGNIVLVTKSKRPNRYSLSDHLPGILRAQSIVKADALMPELIPDLWPTSIRARVLSPSAVLRAQATALSRNTSGCIRADIVEIPRSNHQLSTYAFDLFSPPIGYTERLFAISYNANKVYPAVIESTTFKDWKLHHQNKPVEGIDDRSYHQNLITFFSQDTLILGLRYLFNHKFTIASLESIMARCNEIGVPGEMTESLDSSDDIPGLIHDDAPPTDSS